MKGRVEESKRENERGEIGLKIEREQERKIKETERERETTSEEECNDMYSQHYQAKCKWLFCSGISN